MDSHIMVRREYGDKTYLISSSNDCKYFTMSSRNIFQHAPSTI